MRTIELAPRALGYFSLGLGSAQALAPGAVGRLIGLRSGRTSNVVMRLVGVRELTAGVGTLLQSRPAGWLWARVAGDAMDIGLLGAAMFDRQNQRGRLALALSAVAGVTATDFWCARQVAMARGDESEPGQLHVTKAITVSRSPADVYRFWRDFRNFPQFMSHLESVAVLDDRRSHWTARGPAGRLVEWDAEMTEDQPDARISWRSLHGAAVKNTGTVRFAPAPGQRGTEIHLDMDYAPPAGELGAFVARLFAQEPSQQVQADLRKLKQVLEVGEVTRSSATLGGTHLFQQPAQPAEAREAKGALA